MLLKSTTVYSLASKKEFIIIIIDNYTFHSDNDKFVYNDGH